MKKILVLFVIVLMMIIMTGCVNININVNGISGDSELKVDEIINNLNSQIDKETGELKGLTDDYSKVPYSDEQLIEMVKAYRSSNGEYIPSIIEVDSVNGDIVTIHLYDIVDDHTASVDWYDVDRNTGIGTNLLGEQIDFNMQ